MATPTNRNNDRNNGNKPVDTRNKYCRFKKNGIKYVDYKDLSLIKPFLNERAKIKARRMSNTCASHQTQLAAAVKNAREMALLPYAGSGR